MARIRKKATQRTILLGKRVFLRYLFTSEITLIRKVFKYSQLWKLYARIKRRWSRIRSRSTKWFDLDVPSMDKDEFINNFCLSRSAFVELCQILEPDTIKKILLPRIPFQFSVVFYWLYTILIKEEISELLLINSELLFHRLRDCSPSSISHKETFASQSNRPFHGFRRHFLG